MTHWSLLPMNHPFDSPPAVFRVPEELRGADGVLSSTDEVAYLRRVAEIGPGPAFAQLIARRAAEQEGGSDVGGRV